MKQTECSSGAGSKLTLTGIIKGAELGRLLNDENDQELSFEIRINKPAGCAAPDARVCHFYNAESNDCRIPKCEKQYELEQRKNDVLIYDASTHLRKLLKMDARHIYMYDGGIMHGREQSKLERGSYLKQLREIREVKTAEEAENKTKALLAQLEKQYRVQDLERLNTFTDVETIREETDKIIKRIEAAPQESTVESDYFIDTLEAAYDKTDLEIMRNAIIKLILTHLKKRDTTKMPSPHEKELDIDFILCLKTGNQLLANSIKDSGMAPESLPYVCIRDAGNVCIPKKQDDIAFDSQSYKYENWKRLLKIVPDKGETRLRGILIDCAISDGHRIVEELRQFNHMLEQAQRSGNEKAKHIEKVTEAFVLQGNKEIKETKFGDITIHRFFDTDNHVRETIFKHSTDSGIGGGDAWVNRIYKYMEENDLLLFDR